MSAEKKFHILDPYPFYFKSNLESFIFIIPHNF